MPNSAKARAALQQIQDDARISTDALTSVGGLKTELRDLELGLVEIQSLLEEVEDQEDVDTGIEEARQQTRGTLLEVGKLRDRLREVERNVRRLNRIVPDIRGRLEARAREVGG